MPVKGGYLALTGGGILLAYSGLRGKSWSTALHDLLSGRDPAASTTAYEITPGTAVQNGSGITGGTAGDMAGVLSAQAGVTPYRWGGSSFTNGADCSGIVNRARNTVLGLAIPGYPKPHSLPASSHGPPTLVWMTWVPAHASRISRANVQRNDICLWQTHMGVATSHEQYVSAYDTQKGTLITSIDKGGPSLEIPTFWRMHDYPPVQVA